LVAAAAVFSAIYSILGLIPVSAYIGVGSFLTFREVLSPLAGMLFGPLVGGFSMLLGNGLDIALGKPVVFDFLDFIPDFTAAVVAGFVFTGRRKAAVALPLLLLAWYSLDPLSAAFVDVGGLEVPFVWMHLSAVALLSVALVLESKGKIAKLGLPFVGATALASTMTAHISGSIVYENVLVRINEVMTYGNLQASWVLIFYAYPAERALFTLLGTVIAVPVLKSVEGWARRGARVS
jgi:hypothetical protein